MSTTQATLGTWKDRIGRTLRASYLEAGHVRVDRSDGTTDVYTDEEWAKLVRIIKSAGFKRQESTDDLREAANRALLNAEWSKARALLDDLGQRQDNTVRMPPADCFGVPEMIRQLIQDRIDLVNARAGY